ncbi:MAG: hypothetical protein QNJ54_10815 [Prochloraceae cyanobacterium]|nr:hypothetical protein [Prochloraceae cyanobacterium]
MQSHFTQLGKIAKIIPRAIRYTDRQHRSIIYYNTYDNLTCGRWDSVVPVTNGKLNAQPIEKIKIN